MGNYASKRKKVGYLELRESIPGSLVSDQDFDLFYSLCRIESVRTISTLLHPSSSQLFFVVVSGEVHIHLTSPDVKNKSTIAAVFKAGETIHFFNLTMKPGHNVPAFDFGECVRNGNIKLAMHFKSGPNSVARVIGIDRPAFDDFLIMAQNNTHTLNSFLGLTVSELPHKSPFFKTITADQMSTFGPLLKIRLSFVGKMVSPFTTEMAIQCQRIGTPLTPKAKKEPPAANYTPAGQISLLLSGTCLSVPYEANLSPIMQKLQESQSKVPSTTPRTVGLGLNSGSKYASLSLPSFKKASNAGAQFTLSTLPPPIFHPTPPDPENSVNSIQSLGKFISQTKEVNVVDRSKMQVTMHPGTLMGLSEYFCRSPRVVPRASLASSPCVVGYLELSTLDALFAVDPRFERVIKRNYNMLMMAWLKPTVPLLRDMDEWSFALLSCKISIRCYLGGTLIYKKGDPSDFAYIMLCGSVKEVTESGSLKVTPTGGQKGLQIERIMNWGTLFGEVALVTNSPYFNTTTAQEPTMVLCISKHVLEQIYNNNKTKLCEIRIRLLGGDVGLHHVIDHPRGSVLFQTYLDKELAGESLRFYCAVDRYDSMCRDLRKQYNAVVKLRQDNIELLSSGHAYNGLYNMQYMHNMVTTDTTDVQNEPQEVVENHNTSFITLLSPHSVPSRRRRGSNNSIGSVGNVVDSAVDNNADVLSSIDAVHVDDQSVNLYLTQPEYTEHSILNDMQSPHSVHSAHTANNNIYSIPADPDADHSGIHNTTHDIVDDNMHTTHYTPDTFLHGNETHTVTTTITYPTTSDTNTTHNNNTHTNPTNTTSPLHNTLAHDANMPYLIPIPSSTQSSFAYSSTKTSASNSSNKSMLPYMNSHSTSGHNTKNNSVDMSALSTDVQYTTSNAGYGNSYTNYTGANASTANTVHSNNTIHSTDTNHSFNTNYLFTDDTETHSNKESVHSHGSVRSMDSNKSEHFLHSMQDANTTSTTLYEQLHSTNNTTHNAHHTHHHNPYKLTHKPMLESIMSESNFSQTTDGEDGNSSVKFSVKQKPTPQGSISAGAYGYSSKIAPLMEHEEENEEDGNQSVTSGSAFTVANLKKAMQYATSIVDGGSNSRSSPAVSPKHSAVSPKHGSGGSPKHHTTTNPVNANTNGNTSEGGGGSNGSGRNSGRVGGGSAGSSGSGGAGAGAHAANTNTATDSAGVDAGNVGIAARLPLTLDTADNTHDNTNANTNESAARTHSPERAQEVARSITQKLHRIQKNIVELKQVARSIMQVYIYNGSEAQLNLPDTLRIRTEQRFAHWSSSLLASVTSDAIVTAHPSTTGTQPNTNTVGIVNITSPPSATATNTNTTNTTNTTNPTSNAISTPSFDLQDGSTRYASNKNNSTDTTSNYTAYVHVPTNTTNTTTTNPIHPTFPANTIVSTTNAANTVAHVDTTITNPYTTSIVRYDSIMSENTSSRSVAPHAGATHAQFRGSAVFYSTYNTNHDDSGKLGMSTTMSNSNSSRFIPTPIRIPTTSSVNFGSSDSVMSDGPVLLPASVHNTHSHTHGASAGAGLYHHGYSHIHSANTNTTTSINAATNPTTTQPPIAINTTTTNPTQDPTITSTTHTIPPLDVDLSFIDLFLEAKTEILKLLRDDKFPRFKNTPEFHAFIASIKPYEKEQNVDNSQNHSRTVTKSGKYRNSAEFDKSMEF